MLSAETAYPPRHSLTGQLPSIVDSASPCAHPVVDESNAERNFARQDSEHWGTLFDAIDSRHVEQPRTLWANGVLDLLFAALLPLVVTACGNEAPAPEHPIFKKGFLGGCLAPGIDDPLF